MKITPADRIDCRAIAELAMMAGEGIPGYFWAQSQQDGEDLYDVGARNASQQDENFSYRNAWLARRDDEVAGMLLAYRLPASENAENVADYPQFIQPLIELENEVPGSFYINMLASYPQYRNLGIGAALMATAEHEARARKCTMLSLQVFDQNQAALRFYLRLGYAVINRRNFIAHECFRYGGEVLLLSKILDQQAETNSAT